MGINTKQRKMLEKISICIATYKRFEMLSNCILKINDLDIPTNIELNIVIVDGELSTPNEQIEHIKQISKFPLSYNISKKNGIASNRNQLMDFALEKNADYIAFIDDDEYPNKNWIFNLYTNIKKYNADVASGGVNYIKPDNLPDNIPQYLIAYSCKKTKNRKTQLINKKVATNNVLFSASLCKKQKMYFDEKFNFTGGEDSDFFTRSLALKNKHLWVNDSVVNEVVAIERINFKYLFKRRITVSASKIRIYKKYHNYLSTVCFFTLKLLNKLSLSLIYITSAIFNHKKRLKLALSVASLIGYIYGLFNFKIYRYDNIINIDKNLDTINIITICWGKKYIGYPNKVYEMLKKNTSFKFNFYCFTDHQTELSKDIIIKNLPSYSQEILNNKTMPVIWAKEVGLCDNNLTPELVGKRVFFLDLDLIITGNLDALFNIPKEDKKFYITRDWRKNDGITGQASFYSFIVGSLGHLLENFKNDPQSVIKKYKTASQEYLSHNMATLQCKTLFFHDKSIRSFKFHAIPKWPLRFFLAPKIPKECKILVFHGKINPPDALKGVWPEHRWWKKIYKFIKPSPWLKDYWRI